MPRKNLIRSSDLPYHVTARSNNREHFYLPLEKVWKILTDQCFEVGMLFGAQVQSLVLMPNHFHLIMTTPHEDLGEVMMQLMRSVTKSINLNSRRTGHVFGGRYHWTLIDSQIYFSHALKYVYRNPVRAGICARVEEYQFSSLQGLIGNTHLPFPLHYPFGYDHFRKVPNEVEEFLQWLNRPFRTEHQEAIQRALRRTQFSPPKNGWKAILSSLNEDLA